MNNSADTITYKDGTESLAPGKAAVWIDGVKVIGEYNFARAVGIESGPIQGISISADSTSKVSLDVDNVTLFEGAHVLPPLPQAASLLLSANVIGDQIELKWQAKTGKLYQVQYKDNLNEAIWQNLGELIFAETDEEKSVMDTLTDSARFYQVSVF